MLRGRGWVSFFRASWRRVYDGIDVTLSLIERERERERERENQRIPARILPGNWFLMIEFIGGWNRPWLCPVYVTEIAIFDNITAYFSYFSARIVCATNLIFLTWKLIIIVYKPPTRGWIFTRNDNSALKKNLTKLKKSRSYVEIRDHESTWFLSILVAVQTWPQLQTTTERNIDRFTHRPGSFDYVFHESSASSRWDRALSAVDWSIIETMRTLE